MLEKITIGWVWLERTLNTMIDAINAEKPLPSASIAVEESPNGTLLKVTGISESGQTSGGGGGGQQWPAGVGWQALTVVDPSDCSSHVLYYWGTPPGAPHP
jgi:hypothetical protein